MVTENKAHIVNIVLAPTLTMITLKGAATDVRDLIEILHSHQPRHLSRIEEKDEKGKTVREIVYDAKIQKLMG